MQINKKLQGAICASLVAVASPAFASSVIVGASDSNRDGDTATAINTISGFTVVAGSNQKLVVAISYETASNLSTLTWNGGSQNFTLAVDPGTTRETQIWYLDDPAATTGDIVATFDGNARSRMGVLSLTNAAAGGPVVSNSIASGATSLDLTTPAPDTFVLGAYVANGIANLVQDPFSSSLYNSDSGSSWGIAGYQNEAAAGLKTYAWSNAPNADIPASISLVGFAAAVPEPSVSLLGLSAALLLLRRRRA